ncbi:MAG TPA: type II toxin-antitoxin system PrlF family antitoxin [Longimicrobium sp.]|nr:type II toxin-antitoxin system PrlF family antitoxin [Longimicrobium sp.]
MPQHQTGKPMRPKPETSSSQASSFLASKVTARSQTTIPSGVRKALGLRAGDQIVYEIERDQVVIRKVIAEDEDPALDGFLDLLEKDIARHKDRVIFATEGFANYLQELTVGIEVDYDAPIEGDFQL